MDTEVLFEALSRKGVARQYLRGAKHLELPAHEECATLELGVGDVELVGDPVLGIPCRCTPSSTSRSLTCPEIRYLIPAPSS